MPTPLPFGPPDFQTFLRPWSGRRGVRLGSSWPNGSIVHTQGCWDRGVRGHWPHQFLADQLTLFKIERQIIPTKLLVCLPGIQTLLRP